MTTSTKQVTAKASSFAKAVLTLKGKPLSFDKYKPWELIYDLMPKFMVLIAGRQIGKSVSLGGRSSTQSIVRSHFNSLYVTPFSEQAKRFSKAYLDPFIESPLIKKHFKDRAVTKNVLEKSFTSGSRIYLSYAQDERDADRIRGIMADQLMYDEVQDAVISALPAIFETLSASEYGYKVLSGTAKSTSNTIELLWQTTCKFEWVMRCSHCGYWNIPDTYEHCLALCVDPNSPVCMRCSKPIDVTKGEWVATRPSEKHNIGFHLPQIIMSANTSPKKWKEMYYKVQQAQTFGGMYSPAKLSNEVFGISTDLAGKTISVAEAMRCCNENQASYFDSKPDKTFTHVILGVDWSVTGSTKSYTVGSVFGFYSDGKMELIYSEKIQGVNIIEQIDRMIAIYYQYQCDLIASDRGVGVVQVQTMQSRLGFNKVVPINYTTTKLTVAWNKEGLYLSANRTRAIDDVVMKIKHGIGRFETPSYEVTKPMWKDALSIYEEETSVNTRVYRHHPDEPDDWIHSAVFAYIGFKYSRGEFVFSDERFGGQADFSIYSGVDLNQDSSLVLPSSQDFHAGYFSNNEYDFNEY